MGELDRCSSVIKFGDDFGDNECTFHCQLKEGHEGKHKEVGFMYTQPFELIWEGNYEVIIFDESFETEPE